MKPDNSIEVHNLYKSYKIYPDKGNQLKERLLFWKRSRYEKLVVLNNISFEARKGEAIGLIGHNGCGKSTTLKLLTGIIYPDKGSIEMKGRVSSLIELGAGFHPDLSGRENIYTNAAIFGLTRKEIKSRIQSIIDFSELESFIDNPVRTYSSGMYMRLAFSVAINVDADILLIDEILAVGDISFQEKCFKKLEEIKSEGTTIIIVSHALEQIEKICDRSIWIDDGRIREEGSPNHVHSVYKSYMSNKSICNIDSSISELPSVSNYYEELKAESENTEHTSMDYASINKRLETAEKSIRAIIKYSERWNDFLSESPLQDGIARPNFTEKWNKEFSKLLDDRARLTQLNTQLSISPTIWGDKNRLFISEKASVNSSFFNVNSGIIKIGDYTFTGSNVSFLTGSHDANLTGLLRRDCEIKEGNDIIIGNGVWIASNATILGPAVVEDNAVIAAGAVVLPGSVIPKGTMYGGVPAKYIKTIDIVEKYSLDNDHVKAAFEREGRILFVEGWSEKTFVVKDSKKIVGHYLLDSIGVIYKSSDINNLYYELHGEQSCPELMINGKSFRLENEKGTFPSLDESEIIISTTGNQLPLFVGYM